MRICYLDESGTPELAGGTSHFILLGLSIPAETWRNKDTEISIIKQRFGILDAEIHAGWIARRYLEQERIAAFEALGIAERRVAVQRERDAFLIRKAALHGPASVVEDRKNFRKTSPYIHLTMMERRDLLRQVAERVGTWDDCRIFGECCDKTTFGGQLPRSPPFEERSLRLSADFTGFLLNYPILNSGSSFRTTMRRWPDG